MAAGATYEPIATTTLGALAASYTFSSISGAYTDLILVINGIPTSSINPTLQVGNGSVDTAANYSYTNLTGNGTSATSGRNTAQTAVGAFYAAASTKPTTVIVNFMNYANTTTYKTMLMRSNGSAETDAVVFLWRSTSAINTIKIAASTFTTGTTLTLYGILAA